jgi:hypothetical protein
MSHGLLRTKDDGKAPDGEFGLWHEITQLGVLSVAGPRPILESPEWWPGRRGTGPAV